MAPLLDAPMFRGVRNLDQFFIQSYSQMSFIYDLVILGTLLSIILGETAKARKLLGDEKSGHRLGMVIGFVMSFFLTIYVHQRGHNLADLTLYLLLLILAIVTGIAWKWWIDPMVAKLNHDEPNRPMSLGISLVLFTYLMNAMAGGKAVAGSFISDIYGIAFFVGLIILGIALAKWGNTRIGEERGTTSADHVRTRFDSIMDKMGQAWRGVSNKLSDWKDKRQADEAHLVRASQTAGAARNTAVEAVRTLANHYRVINGQDGVIQRLAAGQQPTDNDLKFVSTTIVGDTSRVTLELQRQLPILEEECKQIESGRKALQDDITKFQTGDFKRGARKAHTVIDHMIKKKLVSEFKDDKLQAGVFEGEREGIEHQMGELDGKSTQVENDLNDVQRLLQEAGQNPPNPENVAAAAQEFYKQLDTVRGGTTAVMASPTTPDTWTTLAGAIYSGQLGATRLNEELERLAEKIDATRSLHTSVAERFDSIQRLWEELRQIDDKIKQESDALLDKITQHEKGIELTTQWKADTAVLEQGARQGLALDAQHEELHKKFQQIKVLTLAQYEQQFIPAITAYKTAFEAVTATILSVAPGPLEQYKNRLQAANAPEAEIVQRITDIRTSLAGEKSRMDAALNDMLALSQKLSRELRDAVQNQPQTKKNKKVVFALDSNSTISTFIQAPDVPAPNQKNTSLEREALVEAVVEVETRLNPPGIRRYTADLKSDAENIISLLTEYRAKFGHA